MLRACCHYFKMFAKRQAEIFKTGFFLAAVHSKMSRQVWLLLWDYAAMDATVNLCTLQISTTTAFWLQQSYAGRGMCQGKLSPKGGLNGWRLPRRDGAVACCTVHTTANAAADCGIAFKPSFIQPQQPLLQATSTAASWREYSIFYHTVCIINFVRGPP